MVSCYKVNFESLVIFMFDSKRHINLALCLTKLHTFLHKLSRVGGSGGSYKKRIYKRSKTAGRTL